MKTGNTRRVVDLIGVREQASMEPGHEDREYSSTQSATAASVVPQWSPVMKTGNTLRDLKRTGMGVTPQWSPVMKTGNTRTRGTECPATARLNGARS